MLRFGVWRPPARPLGARGAGRGGGRTARHGRVGVGEERAAAACVSLLVVRLRRASRLRSW